MVQTRTLSTNAPPPFRNDALRSDALWEFKYRIFALPLALVIARLVWARLAHWGMLAMVLHESGHAITACLTGRRAVPLLWVTMHGEERSWWVVLAGDLCHHVLGISRMGVAAVWLVVCCRG